MDCDKQSSKNLLGRSVELSKRPNRANTNNGQLAEMSREAVRGSPSLEFGPIPEGSWNVPFVEHYFYDTHKVNGAVCSQRVTYPASPVLQLFSQMLSMDKKIQSSPCRTNNSLRSIYLLLSSAERLYDTIEQVGRACLLDST
jgi:hypothetical protein